MDKDSLYYQAQRLAQEFSGLYLKKGTRDMAVAEDQFFASIIVTVFGPETQEIVDNLHHLLKQLSNLISICLNFLTCKTEIIRALSHMVVVKIKGLNMCKTPRTVPGI